MLPIILWLPLEQYSHLIKRECPKCKVDSVYTELIATGWTDGCTTDQPRLIHCVNSNVILVSRIYSCPNQHRVLGHHPDFIHQFTSQNLKSILPFHLWHITGFTATLMNYIENQCHLGLPLQQIKTLLTGNCACLFYTLKENYLQISLAKSPIHVNDFLNFDDQSVNYWQLVTQLKHVFCITFGCEKISTTT